MHIKISALCGGLVSALWVFLDEALATLLAVFFFIIIKTRVPVLVPGER